MTQTLSTAHLIDIAPLQEADIDLLLTRAKDFKSGMARGETYQDRLNSKVVLTLFVENSTRTRTSFEMAALRLGAKIVNWDERISSASKGETFTDTILNLNAIGPDALIMRHHEYNAPHFVAGLVDCPVINAGDSWREHPSQALLDAMTIIENKGSLKGLTIAICGDVSHSRVAGSDMALFTKMGATVHIIAPPLLQPKTPAHPNIKIFSSLEDGLPGCDVVMMLRLQKERMESAAIPDDAAFFHAYGLTMGRLALAKPDAIVMHPGPMNRGVEISDDVADHPQRSVILQQAMNGVFVRMAILDLLIS